MHDPKFEEAVQQKMRDLEFVPSESVWENIRREVAPRQRRRALAAIWWWLVPGIVLLGAGVALYRHSTSMPVAATGVPGVRVPAAPPESGLARGASAAGVSAAAGSSTAAGAPAAGTGSSRVGGGVGPVMGDRLVGAVVGGGRSANRAGIDGLVGGTEGSADGMAGVEGSVEGKAGAFSGRAVFKGYQPGLISCIIASAGIQAPRLYPKPVNTGVSGLPAPKHPWMAGFAGGRKNEVVRQKKKG